MRTPSQLCSHTLDLRAQLSDYLLERGDTRGVSRMALRRVEHLYYKTDAVYDAMRRMAEAQQVRGDFAHNHEFQPVGPFIDGHFMSARAPIDRRDLTCPCDRGWRTKLLILELALS